MMKLYIRECRRIASSIIYYLFIAILVFSWYKNFCGGTRSEIDAANGNLSNMEIGFDRPLLAEPTPDDIFFGSKTSEDDPDAIMTGVTRMLEMEYRKNCYSTYPIGYYKAVTLSDKEQLRVREIICTVTGLTEEQLNNLPSDYFPAVTGTIFSANSMTKSEDGSLTYKSSNDSSENDKDDKTKKFISQVSYEEFKDLMKEMENIIGKKNSNYSEKMMITYFGLSEMTYEEAYAEYLKTVENDKITGGFARLFCDYMSLPLGLYSVFIVVFIWMKDRVGSSPELIYSRRVSSVKLITARYIAAVTMVLIPVLLLSLESLIPLIAFGAEKGISVDYFSYLKYIFWWLLPVVMLVSATGMFFTLLTDSPLAVIIQLIWWLWDKGTTALSGDTKLTTLMIRHNTLRGYEIIQDDFSSICFNRALVVFVSVIIVSLSVLILQQKRRGKINAADFYIKFIENIKNKFSPRYTK